MSSCKYEDVSVAFDLYTPIQKKAEIHEAHTVYVVEPPPLLNGNIVKGVRGDKGAELQA